VQEYYTEKQYGITKVRLPSITYFTDTDAALNFLYPEKIWFSQFTQKGYLMYKNCGWMVKNHFKVIDDPRGILKSMLIDDACMFYKQ
jgi:hypothetical protein